MWSSSVSGTRTAQSGSPCTARRRAPTPLRLAVEVSLGTDLADLGTIASGTAGPELPASVHASGLRWSCATGGAAVTADPPPADALASGGLLRSGLELPPGGSMPLELRIRQEGAGPVRAVGRAATS